MGRKLKVFPYPMKTRLNGLVVVMVCLTGCRSMISSVDHVLHSPADELRQDDLPTHSSKEVWQYVNGKPQFHITDHYFALYIGLWRGFSAEEMDLISKGAALLGHRNIQWTVRSCDSKQMLNEDSEDLWTYENLELSPNGQVIPIKEAIRPDFRYFSLANFNGLHIKGLGSAPKPKRLPEDTATTYRQRKDLAQKAWRAEASLRKSYGTAEFQLDTTWLQTTDHEAAAREFLNFREYRTLGAGDQRLQDMFYTTAPVRWPVGYDERAHKLHHFFQPPAWEAATVQSPLKRNRLAFRLEWDWCQPDSTDNRGLISRIVIPHNQHVAPGPNRTGRTDHGPDQIEIKRDPEIKVSPDVQ